MKHKEIERKYIADKFISRTDLVNRVLSLGPVQCKTHQVHDHYFLVKTLEKAVFRYRHDDELSQLTVKSIEKTPTVRTEINLDLSKQMPNALEDVAAFMSMFDLEWSGSLTKDLWVAYFDDCEIVYYVASTPKRTVSCIEIEAKDAHSLEEGLGILEKYEKKLGFSANLAEARTLFEILFQGEVPDSIQKRFLKT